MADAALATNPPWDIDVREMLAFNPSQLPVTRCSDNLDAAIMASSSDLFSWSKRSMHRHVGEIRNQRVKVGIAKHRLIEPGHLLLWPRAHGLRIADQAAQPLRGKVLNRIHGLPESGA